MSGVLIKIQIAGRTYPLTVEVNEEEAVLKAAESINASIKNLQENYAVKDMQDLLSMSALQLLVEKTSYTTLEAPSFEHIEKEYISKIEEINIQLDKIISL